MPERTVDDVVARAEGNAFFAEELLAAGLQGEALPLALTDVLLARVEQRSPATQQVLRIAAAAGRRVRHEWVAAVGGLAPAELDQALAEAVHHHLLVVSDDLRYRFRHALLREAVIADLLPGERVRLHGAIAAYLRSTPGAGTAAELAHHARESNDLPGAFEASLEAAVDACRVGAPAEQLQHLETALALWTAVPDAARARRPRAGGVAAGDGLDGTDGGGAAPRRSRCCARRWSARGRRRSGLRARLHYTLAQTMVRVEDHAAAHRESAAAMALVPAEPPSEVRTWAAATHARMSYAIGLLAEGDAAAEEALAAADALGLDSAWSDTAVSQVRARQADDPATVEVRLEEALRRARRSGDLDVEMRVLYNLATIAFEAGRIAEALEWTRRATARARDLGVEWAFYAAELRYLQVTALYLLGHWDESLAEADLLARVPEMAAHVRAGGCWCRSAGATRRARAAGMGAQAASAAERACAALHGHGRGGGRPRGLVGRRRHRRRTRWHDVPPACGAVGGRPSRRPAAGAHGARCARRCRGGRAGSSATRPRRSAGRRRGSRSSSWPAPPSPRSTESVGEMGVEGDGLERPGGGRGRAAAREAGGGAVAGRRRGVRVRARLRGGPLALAAGRGVAGDRRPRGGGRAGAGGARGRRAAGRGPAAHRHREPQPARPAGPRRARRCVGRPDADTVFTPREVEVLALMAQGRTNRQIGAELYISEKTASVHVSNILAKLAASSRTEAVAIAAQRGMLDTRRS